jgi:site-specific DNA-cytosine methylase
VTPPKDRGILLGNIIDGAYSGSGKRGVKKDSETNYTQKVTTRPDRKSNCLTKSSSTRSIEMYDETHRPLKIEECELLQGVKIGYTDVLGVSKTARYEALGNGWTIPVIQHIFKNIPELKKKNLVVSK